MLYKYPKIYHLYNIYESIPLSSIVSLVLLFGSTIVPIEPRWSVLDYLFSYILIAIGILALWNATLFRNVRINIIDVSVLTYFIYYLLHTYVVPQYPCATSFLKEVWICPLYIFMRILFSSRHIASGWIIGGIILCGTYEAIYGIIQLLFGGSRNYLFPFTGSFLNPGPFSAYIMLTVIISMYVIVRTPPIRPFLRYATYVSLTLSSILLPATFSRAALLPTAIIALYLLRKRYWPWRYLIWGGFLIICVSAYFLKQGSADGRIITWLSALMTWTDYPLFGVGTGGFAHACAQGMTMLYLGNPNPLDYISVAVTDYAFNDFLFVLVEQGLVGFLLWCTIFACAILYLRKYSSALAIALIALLLFSFFSYPLELMPFKIVTLIIISWCASRKQVLSLFSINRYVIIFGIIIAISCSISISGMIRKRYKLETQISDMFYPQNHAPLKDYYKFFPYETDNPPFLFNFAKKLEELHRYNDSNDILRRGSLVSPDPMFLIIMGHNYKAIHQYYKAEECYKKAFTMQPNRVYPLYCRMLLYQDMGDTAKSIAVAKDIVNITPKISSLATEDMKKRACGLILKHANTQRKLKR